MNERRLPMAVPDGAGSTGKGGAAPGASPAPVEVDPTALRLVGTLSVAGALAGLAIVLVFQWAQPRIEAYQAEVLAQAVAEVLADPPTWHTVYLEDGRFTPTPVADTTALDRVYVGYDDAGRAVGVAVVGAEPGFQDVIRLLFGYDPGTGQVLGMKVLESKETPGLGDKIEKDSTFVGAFRGVRAPLEGVKADRATGHESEVVMITGATISSRAIVDIINHRLQALERPLAAFWREHPGGSP